MSLFDKLLKKKNELKFYSEDEIEALGRERRRMLKGLHGKKGRK